MDITSLMKLLMALGDRLDSVDQHYLTVDTSSHQIIDPEPDRWGLVFFPPTGGKVWLGTTKMTGSEPGLPLGTSSSPIILLRPLHGKVVGKPWFITAAAGGFSFGWIEIHYTG